MAGAARSANVHCPCSCSRPARAARRRGARGGGVRGAAVPRGRGAVGGRLPARAVLGRPGRAVGRHTRPALARGGARLVATHTCSAQQAPCARCSSSSAHAARPQVHNFALPKPREGGRLQAGALALRDVARAEAPPQVGPAALFPGILAITQSAKLGSAVVTRAASTARCDPATGLARPHAALGRGARGQRGAGGAGRRAASGAPAAAAAGGAAAGPGHRDQGARPRVRAAQPNAVCPRCSAAARTGARAPRRPRPARAARRPAAAAAAAAAGTAGRARARPRRTRRSRRSRPATGRTAATTPGGPRCWHAPVLPDAARAARARGSPARHAGVGGQRRQQRARLRKVAPEGAVRVAALLPAARVGVRAASLGAAAVGESLDAGSRARQPAGRQAACCPEAAAPARASCAAPRTCCSAARRCCAASPAARTAASRAAARSRAALALAAPARRPASRAGVNVSLRRAARSWRSRRTSSSRASSSASARACAAPARLAAAGTRRPGAAHRSTNVSTPAAGSGGHDARAAARSA